MPAVEPRCNFLDIECYCGLQVSNHLELIKPSSKDDPEKQKKDEEFASAALGEDAALVGGLQQDESFMGLSNAQHCGKMRALENLLATWLTKGDKVLLFSYSVKWVAHSDLHTIDVIYLSLVLECALWMLR